MNMELRGSRTGKPKGTAKSRKSASGVNGHAEIVHMAELEAASRAALRQAMIADAAYFRAEKRGFAPGHEFEDWLAAEIEVANAQQLTTVSPGEEVGSRRVS
jgi:hypothetical protein